MSFSTMLGTMAAGMLRTCGIFALTLLGSLPLGRVIALLRKSRFVVVRGFIAAPIVIIFRIVVIPSHKVSGICAGEEDIGFQ